MSDRLKELVERMCAPGPAFSQLSASEGHEIADEVFELLADLARARGDLASNDVHLRKALDEREGLIADLARRDSVIEKLIAGRRRALVAFRTELARVTRERDEARRRIEDAAIQRNAAMDERDAARAEVERLRGAPTVAESSRGIPVVVCATCGHRAGIGPLLAEARAAGEAVGRRAGLEEAAATCRLRSTAHRLMGGCAAGPLAAVADEILALAGKVA
jgi:hypothetical protein